MRLSQIYSSNKTVFSISDLAVLWDERSQAKLHDAVRYYAKTGKLFKIKRGIYAKSLDYDIYELASKLSIPSYISLETVLQSKGVIFQDYQTIFSISYQSINYEIAKHDFNFKKIKNFVLGNLSGLENIDDRYWIASKERAFLDMVYFHRDYYFDNLLGIDWDLCFDLVQIYQNQAMETRFRNYYREYAK